MKIKHKVLIITAAVAVVMSLAGYGVYSLLISSIKNDAIKRYEENQQLFARNIANDVEQHFYDIQKRLETIALMPAIRNAQRGESCNLILQDIVEANSNEFSNLGRVDKDGQFICAVNRSIVGENINKYGTYFKQIRDHADHAPAMSNLILPTGSGEPVIAVHVPVYDAAGQFAGTIGGAVYFDELENHMLRDTKLTKNSFVVLHDSNGDILYHPDPLIRGKNLNDKDLLSAFSPEAVIKKFTQDIKSKTSGRLEYALRGEKRVAMYESARTIDRFWTANVAVPVKDRDAAIGGANFQPLLATIIISAVSACTLAALFASMYWLRRQVQK